MTGAPAFAPAQKRTGFRKAPLMGGILREFFLCICTIADRLSPISLKNFLRQGLTETDVWIIISSYLN